MIVGASRPVEWWKRRTVYIAAASREPERVRAAQRMLVEAGHELALDWLTPIEENLVRGIRDRDLTRIERRRHVADDFDAICRAEVVWLLAPSEGCTSAGCWVELGYALGTNKPVIVSGNAPRQLFCAFALHEVDSDAAALILLNGLEIDR